MSSPTQIFIAYSRKDSLLMEKLRTHLRPLERARMAKIWFDGIIEAGKDWEKEIKNHLHSSEIILLLISADFIDSDYCYDEEMMDALKKHEQNEARVIPIILRPCAWKYSPFAKLQVLPKDGQPVIEHEDYAFTDIVETIAKICEERKAGEKPKKSFINYKNSLKAKYDQEKKEEEDVPYLETKEMKEAQEIADSILSGEFFKRNPRTNSTGTFTDPRDGQVYKTVKLKDGRTWMAENLNFETPSDSFLYDGNSLNGKNFGRLYTYEAAHLAAPPGWKIPSRGDWRKMIESYGVWEGNLLYPHSTTAFPYLITGGASQFNAVYGGLRTNLGNYNYLGKFGNYWGSSKKLITHFYSIQFERGLSKINELGQMVDYALSVRCIKDE